MMFCRMIVSNDDICFFNGYLSFCIALRVSLYIIFKYYFRLSLFYCMFYIDIDV